MALKKRKAWAVVIGKSYIDVRVSFNPIQVVETETTREIETEVRNPDYNPYVAKPPKGITPTIKIRKPVKMTGVAYIGGRTVATIKISDWFNLATRYGLGIPSHKKVVELPREFIKEEYREQVFAGY